MQKYPSNPLSIVSSLWCNRFLIRTLIQREIASKYRGSVMGLLWAFFNPVVMLLVYTLVFSVVFKARWSADSDSKSEFALVLFAGLIVFNFFAECIGRAPMLILSNVNYVKRVVFPLEILAWVTMGSAFFHAGISLLVWLVAYVVVIGVPHISVLWMPLVALPLVFLTMGVTWALASLGVYLRDISQLIGIVITALMFLSPIFYPATALPVDYQFLLFINPLTPIIQMTRDVLYWGKPPDFAVLGLSLGVSAIVSWLGYAWFQRTRKGFADVV